MQTYCSSDQDIRYRYPRQIEPHSMGCNGTTPCWKRQGIPPAVRFLLSRPRYAKWLMSLLFITVAFSELLPWVVTSILRHPSRQRVSKMTSNQSRLFWLTRTCGRYVYTILYLNHRSLVPPVTFTPCVRTLFHSFYPCLTFEIAWKNMLPSLKYVYHHPALVRC